MGNDYLEKRTQWDGTDYYYGKVDGKRVTATPKTDALGNPYIDLEVNDGDWGIPPKPPLIQRIIFGIITSAFALPVILIIAAIPFVIWYFLFDHAQGHATETTFAILSAIIGGIVTYLCSYGLVKLDKSLASLVFSCIGPIVSGLFLGGCSALFPQAFQGNVFASSIENFLGGGLIGLLLGIVPGVVGCGVGIVRGTMRKR